jgi:hypothetical protein
MKRRRRNGSGSDALPAMARRSRYTAVRADAGAAERHLNLIAISEPFDGQYFLVTRE